MIINTFSGYVQAHEINKVPSTLKIPLPLSTIKCQESGAGLLFYGNIATKKQTGKPTKKWTCF